MFGADILTHRQRNPDETCFADVSRARAGWLYRADDSGISASRYWFRFDRTDAPWTDSAATRMVSGLPERIAALIRIQS